MKLGNYDFETRIGPTGYCLPYGATNVVPMSRNRIRLVPSSSGSAGLFGPRLGYGTYSFDLTGRTDGIDPNSVIAIWTYDDASKDEIDVLEWGRWGDSNQPSNLLIGVFDAEVRLPGDVRLPARGFRRWKVEAVVLPNSVRVRIWGYWELNPKHQEQGTNPGPGWKLVADWNSKLPDGFVVGQLRLGYWVRLAGFMYPAADRAKYVTFENFDFVPYAPATDDASK